ncbi:MAG: hypothetical protein LUG45_09635 [Clostridiales bacterium]|nr:hypothetical protein [Clostridiales bacterium]
MSEIDNLRTLLHTRANGNPDGYFVDTLWEDEVKCVCSDLAVSIEFVSTKCTDEEFYYLSEIFDDIMEQTRSIDFLKCIRQRAERVENLQWRRELAEDIRFAALYVDEN